MPENVKIQNLLKTKQFGRKLYCLESVDSTNDYLKQFASDFSHGTAVIAELQTKGKGRQARGWQAPRGSSLLMSVLLKPRGIDIMPVITLLCGLSVARALNDLYGGGFGIKWPNDIVCDGRKVCGILCESRIARPQAVAVCGIGINLTQDRNFFERSGLTYGASVKMLRGGEPGGAQTAAAVLGELEAAYDAFLDGGIDKLLGGYRSLCVTLGRQVNAIYKDRTVTGTAVDIGPDGSLTVETGQGRAVISSGEVSVRGIIGYV